MSDPYRILSIVKNLPTDEIFNSMVNKNVMQINNNFICSDCNSPYQCNDVIYECINCKKIIHNVIMLISIIIQILYHLIHLV